MTHEAAEVDIEVLRVTYDTALRKHAGQIAAFESFRGRASNMLGVSIGVAALLGGFGLDRGPVDCQWVLAGAAGAAFVVAFVLLVQVQVASIESYDGPKVDGLIDVVTKGTSIASVLGSVALQYDKGYKEGQQQCRTMAERLRNGSIAVGIEVALLLCLIAAVAQNPTPSP